MTRCCERRLRRTVAACSSTRVTVSAPHSPRRGRRWMPLWLLSGRWSCRCGWGSRPARPNCGGGLLRCGAQPCGAGDGRRARRADPVGRVDGGSAQRQWIWWIWGRGGCGICRPRSGCSRFEQLACGPSFRRCGRWTRAGEPAACGHQLHRARVRGSRGGSRGEGSSAGDVDRGGRGRQDATGNGSRGAAG